MITTYLSTTPALPVLRRMSKKESGWCDVCEDKETVRFHEKDHFLQLDFDNESNLVLCPVCESQLLFVLLRNYTRRANRGKVNFTLLKEVEPPKEEKPNETSDLT